jgi:hypothetical protein
MRYVFAAIAMTLLATPAFGESFNFASGQVVTHRGTNITLKKGINVIDRKNHLTCTSDNGCSVVAQVQINFGTVGEAFKSCVVIDGAESAPRCEFMAPQYPGIITLFQGAPALTKGDHTIETQVSDYYDGFTITSFQTVYTLYQHE